MLSLVRLLLWRDRVDVPSKCTIVKTIEWVEPAYRQRNDVADGSVTNRCFNAQQNAYDCTNTLIFNENLK
jgi:hypothetical protein